ncbi:hypothetical protein HanIR_Chr05g0221521 [Helianthus annuus]|nr:hypothetical protein HanIR_Chr05g0221521 [Helianthus annuus]
MLTMTAEDDVDVVDDDGACIDGESGGVVPVIRLSTATDQWLRDGGGCLSQLRAGSRLGMLVNSGLIPIQVNSCTTG